jgi:hypothetical protein
MAFITVVARQRYGVNGFVNSECRFFLTGCRRSRIRKKILRKTDTWRDDAVEFSPHPRLASFANTQLNKLNAESGKV